MTRNQAPISHRAKCRATAHDFDKFDEATIYCRKCGEQRVMNVQALIALIPASTYPCPLPHYPHYPTWPQYPWWGTTSAPTVTYGDVTSGATTLLPDVQSTYTVTTKEPA